MNLTDEQLDALADRLASTRPHKWDWRDIAREAARWAQERERERLEPLRVAVEAVDWRYRYKTADGDWSKWWYCDDSATMNAEAQEWRNRGREVETQTLYTTPPSADALVEALGKFVRASYEVSEEINPRGYAWCEPWLDEARAAAIAALAKHKENSR